MHTTRRHFIQITFALGAGALSLAACGDDSSSPPPNGNPDGGSTPTAPSVTISANHGHATVVSMADLSAATEKSYDIQGSSGHTHSITVSASDFATLMSTGSVTVQSTMSVGHSHSVTITT